MITRLQGTVIDIADHVVTLDVQGVGYGVHVAQPSLFSIGKAFAIYTAVVWNQENGPTLFGFSDALEKTLFLLITSCSGIGPKIGLALLANLSPSQFIDIVQRADEDALSSINGIGPKKAEQLIMFCKHKVAKLLDQGIEIPESAAISSRQNVGQVLKSLNYSKQEIASALSYLNEHYPSQTIAFDQLMRHALGFLAKRL